MILINALVVFFLAICAIGGMIALTRARLSDKTIAKPFIRELVAVYVAFIGIVILTAWVVIAESLRMGPPPLTWLCPILDICLLIVARGTFTIYRLYYRAIKNSNAEIKGKSIAAHP